MTESGFHRIVIDHEWYQCGNRARPAILCLAQIFYSVLFLIFFYSDILIGSRMRDWVRGFDGNDSSRCAFDCCFAVFGNRFLKLISLCCQFFGIPRSPRGCRGEYLLLRYTRLLARILFFCLQGFVLSSCKLHCAIKKKKLWLGCLSDNGWEPIRIGTR